MTSPSFPHLSLAPGFRGKAQTPSADYSFLQEIVFNLNTHSLPLTFIFLLVPVEFARTEDKFAKIGLVFGFDPAVGPVIWWGGGIESDQPAR